MGIKLSIHIQQNWKVQQLQDTIYNPIDNIYFYLYAKCTLITAH